MRKIKFKCFFEGEIFDVASIDFNWELINLNAADTIKFDQGILLQFTGAIDKNGREIYEGDIVLFHDKNYMVKYFNQYSRFGISSNNEMDKLPMLLTSFSNVEVIGNIYERMK